MADDARNEYEDFLKWRAAKGSIAQIELKMPPKPPRAPRTPKPRTEAQIEATRVMREALARRRETIGPVKSEHTPAYKELEAKTAAQVELLREVAPDAQIVVKTARGRPRGTRNVPAPPTPAVESESEDEPPVERLPLVRTRSKKVAAVVPAIPAAATAQIRGNVQSYLDKLNGR